jgi:hypothetical protein
MLQYFESAIDFTFWFKVLIVMCFAPIWWPVLKAFGREIQTALADEGGLFGRTEKDEIAAREPEFDPWHCEPRTPASNLSGSRRGPGGATPKRARRRRF